MRSNIYTKVRKKLQDEYEALGHYDPDYEMAIIRINEQLEEHIRKFEYKKGLVGTRGE